MFGLYHEVLYVWYLYLSALLGELSGKILGKCFWQKEVEEELADHGLRDKWVLTKESGPFCGSYGHAIEVVDKMRCDQLYEHSCSERCKSKGMTN